MKRSPSILCKRNNYRLLYSRIGIGVSDLGENEVWKDRHCDTYRKLDKSRAEGYRVVSESFHGSHLLQVKIHPFSVRCTFYFAVGGIPLKSRTPLVSSTQKPNLLKEIISCPCVGFVLKGQPGARREDCCIVLGYGKGLRTSRSRSYSWS